MRVFLLGFININSNLATNIPHIDIKHPEPAETIITIGINIDGLLY